MRKILCLKGDMRDVGLILPSQRIGYPLFIPNIPGYLQALRKEPDSLRIVSQISSNISQTPQNFSQCSILALTSLQFEIVPSKSIQVLCSHYLLFPAQIEKTRISEGHPLYCRDYPCLWDELEHAAASSPKVRRSSGQPGQGIIRQPDEKRLCLLQGGQGCDMIIILHPEPAGIGS